MQGQLFYSTQFQLVVKTASLPAFPMINPHFSTLFLNNHNNGTHTLSRHCPATANPGTAP